MGVIIRVCWPWSDSYLLLYSSQRPWFRGIVEGRGWIKVPKPEATCPSEGIPISPTPLHGNLPQFTSPSEGGKTREGVGLRLPRPEETCPLDRVPVLLVSEVPTLYSQYVGF